MENTVTIDEEEMRLIDRYVAMFKEIPFIAFVHPDDSKKLLRNAIKSRTPYKFDDIPELGQPQSIRINKSPASLDISVPSHPWRKVSP